MNQLLDKAILLLLCLLSLYTIEIDIWFLLSFFMAISVSTVCFILSNKKVKIGLIGCYCMSSLFIPSLMLFNPLVLYDILIIKYKQLTLCYLLFTVFYFSIFMKEVIIFFIINSFITYLIVHKNREIERIRLLHRESRDITTESNLLLSKKNETLIEKQNYEIYNAILEERNRIAREIHDNAGHMLSRSILMLSAIKATNTEYKQREPLAQLQNTLSETMNTIRDSVHDLHEDSIHLEEKIQELMQGYAPLEFILDYDITSNVPNMIKLSIISMTKEALHNIHKHSNATKVKITMVEHPAIFQFIIKDNGTANTNVQTLLNSPHGIGIKSMQDRTRALGGTISITYNKGIQLFITIPNKEE